MGGGENAKQVIMGSVGMAQQQEGEAMTNAGFQEFLKEAKEGMAEEEVRMEKQRKDKGEADKLVDLDNTTTMAALSVEEEREMKRAAGFEDGMSGEVKKRPLWRRVVFCWRRD